MAETSSRRNSPCRAIHRGCCVGCCVIGSSGWLVDSIPHDPASCASALHFDRSFGAQFRHAPVHRILADAEPEREFLPRPARARREAGQERENPLLVCRLAGADRLVRRFARRGMLGLATRPMTDLPALPLRAPEVLARVLASGRKRVAQPRSFAHSIPRSMCAAQPTTMPAPQARMIDPMTTIRGAVTFSSSQEQGFTSPPPPSGVPSASRNRDTLAPCSRVSWRPSCDKRRRTSDAAPRAPRRWGRARGWSWRRSCFDPSHGNRSRSCRMYSALLGGTLCISPYDESALVKQSWHRKYGFPPCRHSGHPT